MAEDPLGRPIVSAPIRAKIEEAFKVLPPSKRGALLVIAEATPDGRVEARAHLAAKLNDHWRVAGGAGWVYGEPRPSGYIAVEAAW